MKRKKKKIISHPHTIKVMSHKGVMTCKVNHWFEFMGNIFVVVKSPFADPVKKDRFSLVELISGAIVFDREAVNSLMFYHLAKQFIRTNVSDTRKFHTMLSKSLNNRQKFFNDMERYQKKLQRIENEEN